MRVPWTARRSNQSILKEINPEYSLEGLIKLHYFAHLMQAANSLEKILMLGKIKGRRRRGQQRIKWHHRVNVHEFEQILGDSVGQESLVYCSPWDLRDGHNLAPENTSFGEDHLLYSAHQFNSNLFQKRPHRHTQKQCLAICAGIPWPYQCDTYNSSCCSSRSSSCCFRFRSNKDHLI